MHVDKGRETGIDCIAPFMRRTSAAAGLVSRKRSLCRHRKDKQAETVFAPKTRRIPISSASRCTAKKAVDKAVKGAALHA